MNDNTIIRIRVPKHLYESVKAQLTLNEANLTLQNYARKLYSLFKKSGATPLVITGKNFASPDVKNSNVSIAVAGDELKVGMKGTPDIGKKYADLVAKEFPDMQMKGSIQQAKGWGGDQDAYTTVTLVPKTTGKKGGTNVTEDFINEGQNFGMPGATTVKEKKSSSDAPKKASAPKKANAPQKATGAMYDKETSKLGAGVSETKKTPKDGHKKMGLEELKALAEMLKNQISEMEGEKKEGEEGKEQVDELHFQSFIKTPGQKDKEEDKKEKVQEKKAKKEDSEDLKEYNRYDRDEPDEYDPRDYELGYARSGGRSYSRKDVERMKSGLYSDDEISAAQQADAVRAGRIPAPKQTPRGRF